MIIANDNADELNILNSQPSKYTGKNKPSLIIFLQKKFSTNLSIINAQMKIMLIPTGIYVDNLCIIYA